MVRLQVWNFQNGHNLHKLEPAIGESEVTGILPLLDKKIIVVVGWSQLITTYDNSDANVSIYVYQLHIDLYYHQMLHVALNQCLFSVLLKSVILKTFTFTTKKSFLKYYDVLNIINFIVCKAIKVLQSK